MPVARTLRVLLLLGAIFGSGLALAQAPGAARETAVKAAFLSKFAGFVEWPAGTLSQPDEPLVIGVVGADEIVADLQQIASVRTGDLRPISVRRLADANVSSGIHILFIGAGCETRVREVVSHARGPVLVVTEQEEGLRLGGVLNFSVDNGRVRFAASPAAAEARGLRLSARLLALAQSVEGRGALMFKAASSIGRKLNLIVAVTTVVALALAAAAVLLVDFQRGLNQARQEAQTLTDVLALASAPALSFSDARVAAENLSMLRAKPSVVGAAVYDAQGHPFAKFQAGPSRPVPARAQGPMVTISGNFVDVWRPVVSNGEPVGTIWIQMRHERLSQTLQYVGIVALIMAVSLGGALLLSRRLQRTITAPIAEVGDVARSIISGETSGVRAVRRTDDEVGQLVEAFNAMLDDLERRSNSLHEANEALRRSETRYQLAVRGSSAGLWDWDIAADEFFISPRFRELLGYTVEQLPDAPDAVLSIMHDDDARRVHSALVGHLRNRLPFQLECRLRDASGRWRWFYMAGSALWDDKGRAYRMAGSVVEVTERKEAERVLQDANRAKDEFLATLAHELRNPLAPIRTGLEILRRDKSNGQHSEQARATMERQLAHMVRLIDDLLDISRINSGKIQLAPERLDLLQVVETALELSRPAIDAAGHQLEVDLPAGPVFLMGDATRLAQALGNLLNNASRYTPAGGRIALRVRPLGKVVEIAVEDNGEGIPAGMLESIFQLFTQLRVSGRAPQGGLGIGLYLVRSLVELHGGTVVASSPGEGKGSTFTVRLPCFGTQAVESADPQAGTEDRGLADLKVLVVDDNVDAAETLSLVLQMEGCTTAVFHDGSSALEGAAAFGPDVILLDIGLPDMTGYEVAKRLKRNPAFERSLLIAITGWGTEEDRKRSESAGFDHHLTKPVELGALDPLLRRAASRVGRPHGAAPVSPPTIAP